MGIFNKYKIIFIIVGFITIVFTLAYFLYVLFFKPAIQPPEIPKEPITPPTGVLPVAPAGPGQIVTPTMPEGLPTEKGITPKKIISPVARGGVTQTNKLNNTISLGTSLNKNGSDLQYYNQEDGKFYRLDKDGNTSPLTDKVFYNVESIDWSPNKNKAILEYPDGANIMYDFATQEQITLPKHWKDFNFSPDGNQIVMKSMGLDKNNRWLTVANVDGSKARSIEPLGDKDTTVYPSWSPNGQSIALYARGIDFDRQEVFFVGLNNENFKSIILEGRGFQSKWSPEGNCLLYSVYSSKNDLKPMLWIVNAKGDNIGTERRSLNIETWANKCTFANSNELYCAVPENLEEGAGLFPELANNTRNQLYKIDTRTGLKKLIAIPDGSYNMDNLIISANGYYLYFTDKITRHIYKIKLK